MAERESIMGGPDALLALYYEGCTGGLFDEIPSAVDDEEGDEELERRFVKAVLETDPDYVEALAYLGNLYTREGEHARGLELDLKLTRLRPDSARAHYNTACSLALLGRKEEALRELETAINCGFDDASHLAKDEDLGSLHDDPRFAELLARAREGGGASGEGQ